MLKYKNKLIISLISAMMLLLSSCGSNNDNNTTLPGANIVGAVADISTVKASIATPQYIRVVYQTNTGEATKLTVGLTNLPRYWSSPSPTGNQTTFSCSHVTSDNGCVLNLVYAPLTAQTNESFNLPFEYINNAGANTSGNLHLVYNAESVNHVVYSVNPVGLINPAIGSTKNINIYFNTDESNTSATNLKLNNITLPNDWYINNNLPFNCSSISSSGTSCALSLTYKPTLPESGTVNLSYSYINAKGKEAAESLLLLYNVGKGNEVVASYPRAINLSFDESKQINIKFTTSDDEKASQLVLDLSKLSQDFPGWTSDKDNYICSNVESCPVLSLTYAPESTIYPARGYLNLPYKYVDKANISKTGAINLWYKASAHNIDDTINVTSDPLGIVATTLDNTMPVTVSFSSTRKATNFKIISGLATLSSLNPGWSASKSDFSCKEISLESDQCDLHLYYTPTNLTNHGSVILTYTYTNDNGDFITANYIIDYHPKAHNKVIIHLSDNQLITQAYLFGPPGTITNYFNLATINYNFTTDDGLTATNLQVGLIIKPHGESSIRGTISNKINQSSICNVVSGSASLCQGSLRYGSFYIESGDVVLQYSYTNNLDQVESDEVTIPYASIKPSNKLNVSVQDTHGTQLNNEFPLQATINESSLVTINFSTFSTAIIATGFKLADINSPNWDIVSLSNNCNGVISTSYYKDEACHVMIRYTPKDIESGVINLNYSYIDNNNELQKARLAIPYRSFKSWHLVGRYNESGIKHNSNLMGSSLSSIVFKGNNTPVFSAIYTFWHGVSGEGAPRGVGLATFQLKGDKLVETSFESNIMDTTAQLISDKYGEIYRAYAINADHSTDFYAANDNIVVQKLIGESWVYVGESTGIFKTQGHCLLAIWKNNSPGNVCYGYMSPSLTIDSHNNLYLTSGFGILNYGYPTYQPDYVRKATTRRVLEYNSVLNNWSDVGNFTKEESSSTSLLAIDNADNLYAMYTPIKVKPDANLSLYGLTLYKYNQQFWQEIAVPAIDNGIRYDSTNNIIFDSANNLYLISKLITNNNNIIVIKYNGVSWVDPSKNSNILLGDDNYGFSFSLTKDNKDNLYAVISSQHNMSVYKFNQLTKLWDNIGQRYLAKNIESNAALISNQISISPDQSKLYVAGLYISDKAGVVKYIDLYSYNLTND